MCGERNSTKSDPIVYCFCQQTILNMLSFRFRENNYGLIRIHCMYEVQFTKFQRM